MNYDDILINSDIYVIRYEGDIKKCKVVRKVEEEIDKYIVVVDDENNIYKISNDRLRFICYPSEESAMRYVAFIDNISQIR